MLKSIAIGYGWTAALAFCGAYVFGGTALIWVLFVWLTGAPITLLVAGLRTILKPQVLRVTVTTVSNGQKTKVPALR